MDILHYTLYFNASYSPLSYIATSRGSTIYFCVGFITTDSKVMPISINMKELMEVKSFIFCILYVPSREIFRKLHFLVAEDRNTKCSIKWEEDKERERTSLVTRDLRRIKTKYFDSLSSISIMCPHTWDSGPVMCHYKLYPAEHSRHSAQLDPSFVSSILDVRKENLCVYDWVMDIMNYRVSLSSSWAELLLTGLRITFYYVQPSQGCITASLTTPYHNLLCLIINAPQVLFLSWIMYFQLMKGDLKRNF